MTQMARMGRRGESGVPARFAGSATALQDLAVSVRRGHVMEPRFYRKRSSYPGRRIPLVPPSWFVLSLGTYEITC